MSTFSGYAEAQKIDDQISDLIGKNEIRRDNSIEWLRFSRTIETSMVIIAEKVAKIREGGMNKETEAKALKVIWESFCRVSCMDPNATAPAKAVAFLKALEEGGFGITPKNE